MTAITASATEHGSVLLTVTTDTGQQGKADLTVGVAEILKEQIETALVAARLRQIDAALTSTFPVKLSRDQSASCSVLARGHPHRRERRRKSRLDLWAFLHRRS